MAVYGYCRISKHTQNIERQIRNIISAYPNAKIFEETYTGKLISRPVWEKILKKLVTGDTVVFDSVSRMSRNAVEGWISYKELFERGINLVFLKEPQIDTEVYKKAMKSGIEMTGTDCDLILKGVNAYLLRLAEKQVQLAFEQAQKELDDLAQRTKEGIETAKRAGKHIGLVQGRKLITKKSVASKKIIMEHYKKFGGSLSAEETIKLTGIARGTFFNYCRQIIEEEKEKNHAQIE